MDWNNRQTKLIIATLLLVAAAGIVFAASSGPFALGEETHVAALDGPEVVITDQVELTSDEEVPLFPDSNTVDLHPHGSLSSNGEAFVRVTGLEDEFVTLSELEVDENTLETDFFAKQRVDISGPITQLEYRNMQVDDGNRDFSYSGPSGESTIVIYGLDEDTWIGAFDLDTDERLAANVTDGDGVLTLTLPHSDHDVELQTIPGPNFVSGSASPTGPQFQLGEVDTLSIDVTHDSFPEENVTVEFFLNGDSVGNDTLTDAGTASTSITPERGDNEWFAVATDEEFGLQATSQTFSFNVPTQLEIYDESNPEALIDNQTVTMEFFDLDGNEIFTRDTDNGTVPLDGLPDNDLVIRMTTDGYYDRSTIIRSVFAQNRVYMLNDSIVDVETPTFIIDDETGQFDPTASRVFIERPLLIDNSTTYHVVAAEQVGTDGYTETLEAGIRYRIIVMNPQGGQRVLGKFSADTSQTFVLTVEQVEFTLGEEGDVVQWAFEPILNEDDELIAVRFNFEDADHRTTNLHVVIHERGDESNELLNDTFAGPLGEISITEPIPEGEDATQWTVRWEANRNPLMTGVWHIGTRGILDLDMPDWVKHTISVGLILVIGGLASQVNAPTVGISVAGVAGMLWFIGWLPATVGAGAIILGFAIPAFYIVGNGGRGRV